MTKTIQAVRDRYPLAKQMADTAAQARAAFSFDDLTTETRACGYISEHGAAEITIPSSLYALPLEYISGAEIACGDGGQMLASTAPGARVERYKLLTSTNCSQDLVCDRDFTVMNALAHRIGHCGTSQAPAVRIQPEWLTFVMNTGRIRNLFDVGHRNWTFDGGSSRDAAVAYHDQLEFATKGLKGAVEWMFTHADLILQTPCLRSEARLRDALVRRLREVIDAESYRDRVSSEEIQTWIQKHKVDGRIGYPDHPLVRFWGWVRRQVEQHVRASRRSPLKDLGREADWADFVNAIEKLDGHVISKKWILGFFDECIDRKRVNIRKNTFGSTTILKTVGFITDTPEAYLAPERFINAMTVMAERIKERDDTELTPEEVKTFLVKNAADIVTERLTHPDSDLWYVMAKAVTGIGESISLIAGGNLQRFEGNRHARAGWPHILIRHPDRREPTMGECFGKFQVRDLKTAKDAVFEIPLDQISILCDDDGNFLPYAEAVAVLERVYNDFDGTTKELDDFIAELMEEYDNAPWIGHFEEFMRCEFRSDQLPRIYGYELDTEHWWPLLKDSEDIDDAGKEPYSNTVDGNEHALKFTFNLGPKTFEAVYLSPDVGTEPQEQVRRAAAGYVFNSYSDVSKMCWLRYRGMIGDGDEIYSKEWNPFNDLKPNMARDFVDFCFEVPDVDGWQHEISRYDGEGWVYAPPKKSNGETATSGKHEMVPQGWGFAYYRES